MVNWFTLQMKQTFLQNRYTKMADDINYSRMPVVALVFVFCTTFILLGAVFDKSEK